MRSKKNKQKLQQLHTVERQTLQNWSKQPRNKEKKQCRGRNQNPELLRYLKYPCVNLKKKNKCKEKDSVTGILKKKSIAYAMPP